MRVAKCKQWQPTERPIGMVQCSSLSPDGAPQRLAPLRRDALRDARGAEDGGGRGSEGCAAEGGVGWGGSPFR
jgi:hypothetical protein